MEINAVNSFLLLRKLLKLQDIEGNEVSIEGVVDLLKDYAKQIEEVGYQSDETKQKHIDLLKYSVVLFDVINDDIVNEDMLSIASTNIIRNDPNSLVYLINHYIHWLQHPGEKDTNGPETVIIGEQKYTLTHVIGTLIGYLVEFDIEVEEILTGRVIEKDNEDI